jgi:flagellin-like protein
MQVCLQVCLFFSKDLNIAEQRNDLSMRNILSKKGIMGVETLIIFIAMIIVAAIAAAVLLRTQGLLQQRALAVGNEARERIATGLEVISVVGTVNTTLNSIRQVEINTRLRSGSEDIDLRLLGITLTTRTFATQLFLLSRENANYKNVSIPFLTNATNLTISSVDYDPDFPLEDKVILVTGNKSPDNLSGLQFYLDSNTNFVFPLGINFSLSGTTVNIEDLPIRLDSASSFSASYGYLTLVGKTNGTAIINTNTGGNWTQFFIESDIDTCSWASLVADYRFCYAVRLGNTNTIIEPGEVYTLRIKLTDARAFIPDEIITMQIVPKGGSIDELSMRIPQVLSRLIETLWP